MDILNTGTNAKEKTSLVSGEIRKGEELMKSEMIPNTPFVAKWIETVGWFAVCGKYRLTEPFETEAELIAHVEKRPWDMIIALMNIVQIENLNLIEETTK
jgi:hypothetical protein